MQRKLFVGFALAVCLIPGAARAQSIDPLRATEAEAGRWAARALNDADPAAPGALPPAWSKLGAGSLDALMARGEAFTRVFPSAGRRMAAVVTWSRSMTAGAGATPSVITARLAVVDAAGAVRGEFAVEPLMAFDVTDAGDAVVGHGEEMNRLIECGALNTTLAFYSGEGLLVGLVRRNDFSPGYATALLPGARRFVIGVTGQVLAYDLADARQAWRHALRPGDRPWLVPAPGVDEVVMAVSARSGPTRLLRLDASGVERASGSLAGRVNPGSGLAFDDDLLVVHESTAAGSTFHLLEPRTLRTLRSVERN